MDDRNNELKAYAHVYNDKGACVRAACRRFSKKEDNRNCFSEIENTVEQTVWVSASVQVSDRTTP